MVNAGREFAERSSVPTLEHGVQSRLCVISVFWLLVSIGFTAFSVQQTVEIITKFFLFDTKVVTKLNYDTEIEFPAITACNLNPYKKSALSVLSQLSAATNKINNTQDPVQARKKRTVGTAYGSPQYVIMGGSYNGVSMQWDTLEPFDPTLVTSPYDIGRIVYDSSSCDTTPPPDYLYSYPDPIYYGIPLCQTNATSDCSQPCPVGFVLYNCVCYYLKNDYARFYTMDTTEAKNNCTAVGAVLAHGYSLQTFQALLKTMFCAQHAGIYHGGSGSPYPYTYSEWGTWSCCTSGGTSTRSRADFDTTQVGTNVNTVDSRSCVQLTDTATVCDPQSTTSTTTIQPTTTTTTTIAPTTTTTTIVTTTTTTAVPTTTTTKTIAPTTTTTTAVPTTTSTTTNAPTTTSTAFTSSTTSSAIPLITTSTSKVTTTSSANAGTSTTTTQAIPTTITSTPKVTSLTTVTTSALAQTISTTTQTAQTTSTSTKPQTTSTSTRLTTTTTLKYTSTNPNTTATTTTTGANTTTTTKITTTTAKPTTTTTKVTTTTVKPTTTKIITTTIKPTTTTVKTSTMTTKGAVNNVQMATTASAVDNTTEDVLDSVYSNPQLLELLSLDNNSDTLSVETKLKEAMPYLVGSMSEAERSSLSYQMSDTIDSCIYAGHDCTKEIVQWNDPTSGNCFTFNSKNSSIVRRTKRSGSFFGVSIRFRLNQQDYLSTSDTAGLKLFIHEPDVSIFTNAEGFIIPSGYLVSYAIRLFETQKLKKPYGNCTETASANTFFYSGKYSVEGCLRSCYQSRIIDKCGCGDPNYPLPSSSKKRKCEIDKLACVSEMANRTYDTEECHCEEPCTSKSFGTTCTKATLSSKECDYENNTETCISNIRTNKVALNVYFLTTSYNILEQTPAYPLSSLFGDFGGIVGFYLGICIIGFLEIICTVFLCIFGNKCFK